MAGGYWFGKDADTALLGLDNFQSLATEPGADPINPNEDTPVQNTCEQGCSQQRDACYQEFGADSIYCGNQYQECMQGCADTGEGPGTETTTPGTTTGGSPCTGGYLASSSGMSTEGINWVPDDEWGQWGWQRPSDGNLAAHWYWHPQFGLHPSEVVAQHAQQNIAPAVNTGGGTCPKGMNMTVHNGERWCCPGDGATTKPGLGEYKWPSEMQNFYNLLMGRGTELLGMPLGITPEEQAAMFGKGFENVKGAEGGMQNDLTGWLQQMGALGTGTELSQRGKISRGIQENISDIMRDLLIYGSERKKADLLDYTGAAGGLFDKGMNYNQIQEAINAARRGESDKALMLLMQMMGLLKY